MSLVDDTVPRREDRSMVSVAVRRFRVRPVLLWAVALAAVAAAVLVWWSFARALHEATPVPAADVPTPNAVVWHRKVYRTRAGLARDLRRHGSTYYVWARNHPGAATLLAQLALDRAATRRAGSH